MAHEICEGRKEVCYFCGQSFTDGTEKEEHILSHFKRKHCYICDNELISIGDKWYQLHVDINCNGTKIEPDIDYTDIATQLDPDPLAMAEYIIKSEPIELSDSTVHELDTTSFEMVPVMNQPQQDSSDATKKPHACPFCPATFSFASNRSRHKHQYHKQEIDEIKARYKNKPYSCPFCPATFAFPLNRDKHVSVYHQKKDFIGTTNRKTVTTSKGQQKPISRREIVQTSEIHECSDQTVDSLNIEVSLLTETIVDTIVKDEKMILEVNASQSKDLLDTSNVPNNDANEGNLGTESPDLERKPYACPFCPARFTFPSNCSRHKHQYHKKEVIKRRLGIRNNRRQQKTLIRDSNDWLVGNAGNAELMELSNCSENVPGTASIQIDSSEEIDSSLNEDPDKIVKPIDNVNIENDSDQEDIDLDRLLELSSKPHACPFCPIRFKSASDRSKHKLAYHRQETAKLCKARMAERQVVLPRSSDWRQSIIPRAPGAKAYKCRFCSAGYNQRKACYNHMHKYHKKELEKFKLLNLSQTNGTDIVAGTSATHQAAEGSSSKPFKCQYCPAGYSQMDGLNCHMVRHHKKEMIEQKLRNIIREDDTYQRFNANNENAESEAEDIIQKYETSSSRGQTKYNVDMWCCSICAKSFGWKQNAHKHVRLMHGSNDESMVSLVTQEQSTTLWYCSLCYVTSKQRFCLYTHIWLRHRRKDRRLVKPIEDWQDPDQVQMDANKEVVCDYCPMTFGDNGELNQHKRAQHMKELDDHTVVKCSRCPALFNGSSIYQIHSIRMHGVLDRLFLDKLDCLVCGESFKSCKTLVIHLKTHDAMDSYVCATSSCDAQFDTIEQLHAHLRNHPIQGEMRRKCKKCGNRCRASAFADHHCTENSYCCDSCGKQFSRLVSFRAHLDRHTGNKRYKCEYCPASFVTLNARLVHRRTHTGEKRCKCTVPNCDKAFIQHVDLYRHQYRAHGIFRKKFPCTICDEVFPENSLLRKHLTSHDS